MSIRSFRRFIGIHLGGGRGKSTAVARLERASEESEQSLVVKEARLRYDHRGGGQEQTDRGEGLLFHDEALLAYLKRWIDEDTVVAINAPLTLPPCVRCQLACPGISACTVPVVQWMRKHAPRLSSKKAHRSKVPIFTPYTQRAVDILLSYAELHPRESLGQGMGPMTARATYLRRALSPRLRVHENLLEVHPQATLIRLFGASVEHRLRHGIDEEVWELRKQLLRDLPLQFHYVWPELVARNPHVFDAVICAVTAGLWAKENWHGPKELLSRNIEAGESSSAPLIEDPLPSAIADFDCLWFEDGWIWIPPVC